MPMLTDANDIQSHREQKKSLQIKQFDGFEINILLNLVRSTDLKSQ